VAAFEIVNGWADSTKAKIDGLSKDFDKAAAKTDDLIDKYKKGEITREQFSKGMADSNREMNDAQKKIDDVAARYNGIGGYFNWLYDNVTGNDPSKHKAKGGPVSAGQSYVVGDNPDGTLNDTSELFIPGSSGSIMSSKDLQAALSGSGRQQSPGLSKNVTLRIDNFNINNGGDSHRMLNDIGFALENAS
jgi:hypothetical protein